MIITPGLTSVSSGLLICVNLCLSAVKIGAVNLKFGFWAESPHVLEPAQRSLAPRIFTAGRLYLHNPEVSAIEHAE